MRLLLESGARAQIMEPVAQQVPGSASAAADSLQGGLLLLITMLRQEAPEVQGAACDALAAAFANGQLGRGWCRGHCAGLQGFN